MVDREVSTLGANQDSDELDYFEGELSKFQKMVSRPLLERRRSNTKEDPYKELQEVH